MHSKPRETHGSDHIIAAPYVIFDGQVRPTAEHLWATPVGDRLYEVRSIPFLTHGLALGDVVMAADASAESDDLPAVIGVHRRSGAVTFQARCRAAMPAGDLAALVDRLQRASATYETHDTGFVAVSCANASAVRVFDIFESFALRELLTFVVSHEFDHLKHYEHVNPIVGDVDAVVLAPVTDGDDAQVGWEHLPAQRLPNGSYRLCCVPFYVYGLNLFDEVDVQRQGIKTHVVRSVIKRSGHETLRVWLNVESTEAVASIVALASGHGGLVEFYSSRLVGVDVPDDASLMTMCHLLERLEQAGTLAYERAI